MDIHITSVDAAIATQGRGFGAIEGLHRLLAVAGASPKLFLGREKAIPFATYAFLTFCSVDESVDIRRKSVDVWISTLFVWIFQTLLLVASGTEFALSNPALGNYSAVHRLLVKV